MPENVQSLELFVQIGNGLLTIKWDFTVKNATIWGNFEPKNFGLTLPRLEALVGQLMEYLQCQFVSRPASNTSPFFLIIGWQQKTGKFWAKS